MLQFCKYAGTQICTIKYLLSFTYFNTVISFNYLVSLSKKYINISMEIQRGNCASVLCTISSPNLLKNEFFELFKAKEFDQHNSNHSMTKNHIINHQLILFPTLKVYERNLEFGSLCSIAASQAGGICFSRHLSTPNNLFTTLWLQKHQAFRQASTPTLTMGIMLKIATSFRPFCYAFFRTLKPTSLTTSVIYHTNDAIRLLK